MERVVIPLVGSWPTVNRTDEWALGTNWEDARRRFIMDWMHMHKRPLIRKFRSHLFNYWKKIMAYYFFFNNANLY